MANTAVPTAPPPPPQPAAAPAAARPPFRPTLETPEETAEHANVIRAFGIIWLKNSIYPQNGRIAESMQEVISGMKALKNPTDIVRLVAEVKARFNFDIHVAENPEYPLQPIMSINGGRDEASQVTVPQIQGEAFELFCAMAFKYRQYPLIIHNHESQDISSIVSCTVQKVFMSDNVSDANLRRIDNEELRDGGYRQRLIDHLVQCNNGGNEAKREAVTHFIDTLLENMKRDVGFDILLELKEVESEKIHFMLAQCKFRSNQEAEIDMSRYLGKYFEVAEQARKAENVLCPFFWMSTQIKFDSMMYWKTLTESGRLVLYGTRAMNQDASAFRLFERMDHALDVWQQDYRRLRSEQLLKLEKRQIFDYQQEAVDAVVAHFEKHGDKSRYASVIMATGSGKTLTAYHALKRLEQYYKIAKPSLHISPMIRLVLQNAHEWLAEEVAAWVEAGGTAEDAPIYYAVCSFEQRKSNSFHGCTSVRTIHTGQLSKILQMHEERGNLHRCRFFTTYQGGSSFWYRIRDYCVEKGLDVLHQVFGVTVRDEAHEAAGLGSKSHSAVLNVPAEYSLSFTATPKFHVKRLDAASSEENQPQNDGEGGDEHCTYLTLNNDQMLPSTVGFPENHLSCPVVDNAQMWHPYDLLSVNMLFKEVPPPEQSTSEVPVYDWGYFQKESIEKNKPIIVYHLKSKLPDGRWSIDVDYKDNLRYFGPITPTEDLEIVLPDTLCFGVSPDQKVLCVPDGEQRGLVIHDMTGVGKFNYLGPIAYALSYKRCIEKGNLVPPRLIMLGRKNIVEKDYVDIVPQQNLMAALGYVENQACLGPEKLKWNLTIGDAVLTGTAHQFRAMQQLLGCFYDIESPVKHAIVFCREGKAAKECKYIFEALLKLKGDDEAKRFFITHVFGSDASSGEDMSYDEQQKQLHGFTKSECGVIFNSKLIGIGVDMPSIDACMIIEPSESISRTVQAYGRAMRRDRNNSEKKAYFIIPAISPYAEHWPAHMQQQAAAAAAEPGEEIEPGSPRDQIPGVQDLELDNAVGFAPEDVRIPYMPGWEEKFHLHVKLATCMDSDDVQMIGERFVGTKDATKGAQRFAGGVKSVTAAELLKALVADNIQEPPGPIYGPEISQLLLGAWVLAPVSDVHGEEKFEAACEVLAQGLFNAFKPGADPKKVWWQGYKPKPPNQNRGDLSIKDAITRLKRYKLYEEGKQKIKKILEEKVMVLTYYNGNVETDFIAHLEEPLPLESARKSAKKSTGKKRKTTYLSPTARVPRLLDLSLELADDVGGGSGGGGGGGAGPSAEYEPLSPPEYHHIQPDQKEDNEEEDEEEKEDSQITRATGVKKKKSRVIEDSDGEEEEERKKVMPAGETPSSHKKPAPKRSRKEYGSPGKDKKKPSNTKKAKDKNAPKMKKSAYQFFSASLREQLRAANPAITFSELSKTIGERWKALDAEDKAPFEAQAVADRARYEEEMKAYRAGNGGQEENGS